MSKTIAHNKCHQCRREGTKLYLKGARCESAKCAFQRRDYPPGDHPFRRGKISEYGIRVREKQRCKRLYGLREDQFRRLFELANRLKGNTGENLFQLLERRLDNMVYRMGFAQSRRQARQLIAHGLISVGASRLNRPGYLVCVGEPVAPYKSEDAIALVKANRETTKGRAVPSWLDVQDDPLAGKLTTVPAGEELAQGFEPQLIVEISSR